ncbi:hypothetical protein ACTXT7_003303 [Hymenolepis weldensis]
MAVSSHADVLTPFRRLLTNVWENNRNRLTITKEEFSAFSNSRVSSSTLFYIYDLSFSPFSLSISFLGFGQAARECELKEDRKASPLFANDFYVAANLPPMLQLTELSSQSARVLWRLPQDIECNGELKGFTLELNSSYETNQHFTISPDVTEYTLTELMQGTDYSLRISASTRGGQGPWSPPKRFRTYGEARIIDMEAFLTTGLSTLPSLLPSEPEQPGSDLVDDLEKSNDFEMVNRQAEYKVPDKVNFAFKVRNTGENKNVQTLLQISIITVSSSSNRRIKEMIRELEKRIALPLRHINPVRADPTHVIPNPDADFTHISLNLFKFRSSPRFRGYIRPPFLPSRGVSTTRETRLSFTPKSDRIASMYECPFVSTINRGAKKVEVEHRKKYLFLFRLTFDDSKKPVIVIKTRKNQNNNLLKNLSIKIVDFRGQGLVKAIRLSWYIKWRRQRTSQRQVGWYDGDPDDSADKVTLENGEDVNLLPETPNVMLRLIWWEGDSEPAEEMISASFSSYTLQNLRAGTPYHFRLIAIVPGEDGPSAHTVATPKYRNKDNQDASRSHPIPVNLLVYRITPTEATLQWELPPDSHISGIMGYQVRYQATRRSDSEGDFISILASALPPSLVNISDPSATGVTLRYLHPETVYEFAVRAISRTAEPMKYWSMVQGFETPGQQAARIDYNADVEDDVRL